MVVFQQDPLVADGLLAHVLQQETVPLVFGHLARVGAQDARPEPRQELAVALVLLGGLADDGPGEVEELLVDGLE